MARRHLESHLSGRELSVADVWDWHEFQGTLIGEEEDRTLDALLAGAASVQSRYFGRTRDEFVEFFEKQRAELAYAAMLNLLAATEAALRVNYIVRIKNNKKDEASKAFAAIYKELRLKVGLEEHILETWKEQSPDEMKRAIGEFKGLLKLRHWLAHGRYWNPRLGQDYSPRDAFTICSALLEAIAGG